ncbi:MAG: FprA family A-type flavoprotein [Halothiobacillaceae bacterium]|nr:FprA family A-type flavoprotein [Halothiobacillaceae bacterium]
MSNLRTGVVEGQALSVAPGVHWLGALDPGMRQFDIILKTANGTTYNAYCVRGSSGVAIIDTVKEGFSQDFFTRLESVARYDEICAVVLNHLEPDHSGALPELMRRAPQAQLYISPKAMPTLRGVLKGELDAERIHTTLDEEGESRIIDLGDRHLHFIQTPYLHWPDTQCTWLAEDGLLFSGDVFGCHFCDERLFNDKVGDFRFSFDYYYQHIMRPFREYVLKALDLIEPLPLRLIAPAHGPVLRESPADYVRRYRQLATPLLHREAGDEKTLLIFYVSAYGATERMAQAMREGAETIDGVRVSLFDIAGGEVAPFVDLIEEADGLAFGSPTLNGDAVKPIWDLLSSLTLVNVKNKLGAAFGSFGWSGEAIGLIEDRLRGLKLRVPLKGVRLKLLPTADELVVCRDFGRDFALHLCGRAEKRVLDISELG